MPKLCTLAKQEDVYAIDSANRGVEKDPHKITDRSMCTSGNGYLLHNLACTNGKRSVYIGETGRRQGGRFREHLRDAEKDA